MTSSPPIRLGVSLFSFAAEFVRRELTLEELIARIAELGLGPGVEIVGFQSLRGFPSISERSSDRLREVIESHGLVPAALGGSAEIGRRSDRSLDEDELVEFIGRQLATAARLGFPTLTVQAGTPIGAVRRLVSEAERHEVTIGLEIGAQFGVSADVVQEAWQLMEELDSPRLGFVLDFGTSARALSPAALDAQRERGMSEEALALVVDSWQRVHAGVVDAATARTALVERMAEFDDPDGLTFAWRTTVLFGHEPPESWAPLVPRIVHVHAKAMEIDDAGEDPSIDAHALLRVLQDGGYTGWINSEWEGHLWRNCDDNFGPVVRQQRLIRQILGI